MRHARSPRLSRSGTRLPRYAVVMAGGQGTRFWPRSRRRLPKQLLQVTGRNTLLWETVKRLLPLCSWDHVLVVCSSEQAAQIRQQLPRVPRDQILIEPMGRNTGPCAALAAEWVARRVGDALMIVVPADHVIQQAVELRRALRFACDLASEKDCLVTLGIQPTGPNTGYGYIEAGRPIRRVRLGARWVRRFHEKPPLATARRYIASGRYLWNAGMFVWKASAFRDALDRCAPDLRRAVDGVWRVRRGARQRLRRAYRTMRSVSLDVAVMQPLASLRQGAPRVAVVPARFGWNDVGSWAEMPDIWGCDRDGNAVRGQIVPIDSHRCVVYSPERLVGLVGVKDVILVDSPDAILICARDRAQDVRRMTLALEKMGLSQYL